MSIFFSCLIIVWETLYHLVNHTLCFQLCYTFLTHFFHQLKIMSKNKNKEIIHGIWCILFPFGLGVLTNWHMTIAFNLLLWSVMFQKLHVVGGDIVHFFSFVCIFYILESPLFCIHHNPKVRSLSFHQPRVLIKVTPLMVFCLPSPIFNVFHFVVPYFLLKDFKHVNLFLTMATWK